ncbi:hypothetical protein ACF1AB_21120 [Streptomyces sp. NPDC014846]|uniref:hypothetical protein n=1 Tax=Streptomyces sp. NPDC014846 TaxID=3364922 RepID=UPI0036F89090
MITASPDDADDQPAETESDGDAAEPGDQDIEDRLLDHARIVTGNRAFARRSGAGER